MCHCLVIEMSHGIALVDTGFSSEHLNDPSTLGHIGLLLQLEALRRNVGEVISFTEEPEAEEYLVSIGKKSASF